MTRGADDQTQSCWRNRTEGPLEDLCGTSPSLVAQRSCRRTYAVGSAEAPVNGTYAFDRSGGEVGSGNDESVMEAAAHVEVRWGQHLWLKGQHNG